MSVLISHWLGDWRHLIEKPVSAEGVESTVETRALLLADRDVRFTNLSVRIAQGAAFVRADIVAAPGLLTQETINSIRDKISERVEMPVKLEFSIIPETILRSSGKDNVDG